MYRNHKNQDWIVKKGQPGQNFEDRTAKTELPGKDSHEKAATTGQPGWDCQGNTDRKIMARTRRQGSDCHVVLSVSFYFH